MSLTQYSCKPKVAQLHLPLPCNQYILWLDVSVDGLENTRIDLHKTTIKNL